jgi:hypothetical protein
LYFCYGFYVCQKEQLGFFAAYRDHLHNGISDF